MGCAVRQGARTARQSPAVKVGGRNTTRYANNRAEVSHQPGVSQSEMSTERTPPAVPSP